MKKGQGSLEYLLILAAILAIAVVVVVVANSLLANPTTQADLGAIQYQCSLQQIELIGFTELDSPPAAVKYFGANCGADAPPGTDLDASCQLGDSGTVRVYDHDSAVESCSWNYTS